jgi:hypothetical protein
MLVLVTLYPLWFIHSDTIFFYVILISLFLPHLLFSPCNWFCMIWLFKLLKLSLICNYVGGCWNIIVITICLVCIYHIVPLNLFFFFFFFYMCFHLLRIESNLIVWLFNFSSFLPFKYYSIYKNMSFKKKNDP